MRTITLLQPGMLKMTDTPPPAEPGPGQALVRVHRIGICGTDMHAFKGTMPFLTYPRILGHELGVEVEAVGEGVRNVKPGDRCAVECYLNCGQCIACRNGKTNCCASLKTLGVHTDGGMRDRFVLPADKLHSSETLSYEQLAVVEMLCIGAHAVRRAAPRAGEELLVVGAGPIGLGVMAFAKAAGASVIGMEVREDRIAFASSNLGIERWIAPGREAPAGLKETLNGDLPTIVMDATGSARAMETSFRCVGHGGKLVFIGLFQGDYCFPDPDFHSHEMSILASRNATADDFRHVLNCLETGAVDVSTWITHQAPFDEVVEVFPGWMDPEAGVVKAELCL